MQKLIIPSVEERVEKWIERYGFKPIEEPLRQEMKSMNLLTFPATVMLEKTLIPPPPPNQIANAGKQNINIIHIKNFI